MAFNPSSLDNNSIFFINNSANLLLDSIGSKSISTVYTNISASNADTLLKNSLGIKVLAIFTDFIVDPTIATPQNSYQISN